MDDSFFTVGGAAEAEYTEKRSRFIGAIHPAATEEEAVRFIEKIKTQHRDARHNVFAFLLHSGGKRCSDDGEPSGTAGVPILDILEKRAVTNCVVVVTRYFGGILLGTGGLVRAYSAAASLAIDRASIVKMVRRRQCRVTCSYPVYSRIPSLLGKFDAKITDSDFSDRVSLTVALPEERVVSLSNTLREISNGECSFESASCFFEPVKV